METKKEIRKQVYQARKCMEDSQWCKKTQRITASVISHPLFLEATDIYTYVDYQKEAGTRAIMEEAWRLGKCVWVPKVTGRTMCFCKIDSFQELSPGVHGILEPELPATAEYDTWNTNTGSRCNLMIMPGVAFDLNRGRVGYGGGYYDRYLSEHPDIHTIAIAFDFQIFPQVPGEAHDIRPEILITESRTLP